MDRSDATIRDHNAMRLKVDFSGGIIGMQIGR
jgi:hypothetical protein